MPAFVLYLVLSCITCMAMLYMPSISFILAIIWGILLIITGLETNKVQLLVIFALNVLLIWVMASSSAILIYSIGLPALAMGVAAANQNRGYYDLLKVGLITAVAAGALLISFVYLNSNFVNQFEPQFNNYVKESLKVYEDSGAFEFYEQKGIERSEVEASVYGLAHVIVQHLPALYFLRAALIIVLSLYLAACLARRRGINRLHKLPFSSEVMPWQIAWVVIAGLALWLTGSDASTLRLIGSNILVVLTPILAYFGLSVLFYKLSRIKTSSKRWIIVLTVIIIITFTIPAFIFLALMGLFDSLLDYRKLRTNKEVPL